MMDTVFRKEDNTIEVCSDMIKKFGYKSCFTVDIDPETKPDLVDDGQMLSSIPNNKFNRWRCDPPHNAETARKMYGTDLPAPIKLLKAGARVCKVGSLMFSATWTSELSVAPKRSQEDRLHSDYYSPE